MKYYDAAIIGFGKGGKTLAGALAGAGQNVALIEASSAMYGGTCINVACIPTKTLVHAASVSAVQGGEFEAQSARYVKAISEKDRVTGMLRNKNYHKLADLPNVDVIEGHASFTDATHLSVEAPATDTTQLTTKLVIEADRIFINTGSRPFVPPIPGIEGPRVYTSETLLNVSALPQNLVIIGGGYIGVEFASLYANFGSHVTIIQDTQAFMPRDDQDIANSVLASFEQRGIRVVRGACVLSIDDKGTQSLVHIEHNEHEENVPADAILVATGRKPNVEGLRLEAAGVELNERGAIKVDEHLRTTAENIWAMGDVVGGLQFTYISLDDFRIVKDSLLGSGARTTHNRGAVPYSLFIDPPFARVGMTEKEASDAGYHTKTATLQAAAIPKTHVLNKPVGLLKAVIDDTTDQLLGVHLFCEESPEMINLVKLAIDAGLPYQTLRDAIYTHPTMNESFNDLFTNID